MREEDYKEGEELGEVFRCSMEGKDGKELEDGVSMEKLENGKWEVGVEMGDVCE